MDAWQLFGLCLKLAPRFLGAQPQLAQKKHNIISEKDTALINLRNKAGSVIVVLGSRDTGKTELCYRLIEFLGRPAFAVSPQQQPPSWITRVRPENIFEVVTPKSTLLMDDAPAYMSNRDYHDSFVAAVEKAIPMVRHEPNPPEYPLGEIHLIFSSQSSAQADKYILDCDVAFFKPLGLLMGEVERPSIAKIYRTFVDPEFAGKDDTWIQRHAYMLSRTWRGLIDVKRAR